MVLAPGTELRLELKWRAVSVCCALIWNDTPGNEGPILGGNSRKLGGDGSKQHFTQTGRDGVGNRKWCG